MISAPFVVPLNPVFSQTIRTTLGGQACRINVYTKHIWVPQEAAIVTDPPVFAAIDPIFLDLYVDDVLVIGGVLCLNRVNIVRDAYLGFVGDLSFADLQADEDPRTDGLGSRWILAYWPNLQ